MKHNHESIVPMEGDEVHPGEFANTLTHGLGFFLSVVAAVVLWKTALHEGDSWRVIGCAIYSVSLMAVYAMSTLSHCCTTIHLRRLFRRLDQGFIYLLIVGTYTPFSMAFLRTRSWWMFLGLMWMIALIGFVSKIFLAHRVDRVSLWIYILLGWMPIVATPFLIQPVTVYGMLWMLTGGLCYTLGTVFIVFDRQSRHFHALWHLAVMAGSACHFFVILILVAPLN